MSRIVVLGGGESGCGSAVLAQVKGFDVFLSDRGAIAPKYMARRPPRPSLTKCCDRPI